MSHFNRFNDRRIVDALLQTHEKSSALSNAPNVSGMPNGSRCSDQVIDCIDWNDLGSGWRDVAPFPPCLVPRSSKHLFTEENLESVIAQRIVAALNETSSTAQDEPKVAPTSTRRSFASMRDNWNSGQRSRPSNAVLPLKEARLQPCGEILPSREPPPQQQLTPQQRRLQREIQRDLRKREVEIEKTKNSDYNASSSSDSETTAKAVDLSQRTQKVPIVTRHVPSVTPRLMMASIPTVDNELVLPPIDIPLVSLSFNYDKLSEKMNWWDEEIRKDIQTKADARNRAKLETLVDSEGATLGGDVFSIKSILHTCNYECDCNKYPERQNKLFENSVASAVIAANRDQGGKLKSRYATNVALRRVSRGSAVSQRRVATSNGHGAWTSPPTLPLSAVSSNSSGKIVNEGASETAKEMKETHECQKPVVNSSTEATLLNSNTNGVSGFCSNALGQPKIREAKSIPSIPTDCDVSKAVTLTGKRLQVAVPR